MLFSVGALTRNPGATVNFVGANAVLGSSGSNQIIFPTAAPALSGATAVTGGVGGAGIVPWATVQAPGGNLDFASTLLAQTNTITAFDRYQVLGAAGASDTVKVNGISAAAPASGVNALLLTGGATITNALSISSGGSFSSLLSEGGNNTLQGTVLLAGEGIVFTGANATTNVLGTPTVSGLTISGSSSGTLNVSPAMSSISGQVTLAAGTLQVGLNKAIGAAALNVIAGTLQNAPTVADPTLANPININTGTGVFNITGNVLATAITNTSAKGVSPIVITTNGAGTLVNGAVVEISGVGGNTAANGVWTITAISATQFSLNGTTGNGNYTNGGVWTANVLTLTGVIAGTGSLTFNPTNGRAATRCWAKRGVANTYTGITTVTNTNASGSITAATNAAPIVLTTASTAGLQSGSTVAISGVGGNTAANGTWTITVINGTTFSLNGSNGTASGAYTAGTGSWTTVNQAVLSLAKTLGATQGQFVVGNNLGLANTAVLQQGGAVNQILASTNLTVNGAGAVQHDRPERRHPVQQPDLERRHFGGTAGGGGQHAPVGQFDHAPQFRDRQCLRHPVARRCQGVHRARVGQRQRPERQRRRSLSALQNVTKLGKPAPSRSPAACANTDTAANTVNEGTLQLARSAAAFDGPFVLGDSNGSDVVRSFGNTNQINNQNTFVNGSGTLDLSGLGDEIQTIMVPGQATGGIVLYARDV